MSSSRRSPLISRVPYLPGLDGMRALAVMAVMVFHANHDWLPAGFLGVEVFFVISGYLITLLLIAEHERDGHVSLRAFWGRRLRRLLPALYLTLAVVVGYCALFMRDPLGKLRGDVVSSVFYVTNWYQIWTGQGYAALADFVPLRHLWSLAVEEQFYLVWPLVMLVLLRSGHRRLPMIGMWVIGIAVAIAVGMALLFHPGRYTSNATSFPSAYVEIFGRPIDKNNLLYLSTISRSSGFLLGAGFAMLWRPYAVRRSARLQARGKTMDLLAIIGFGSLALMMALWELNSSFTGKYYPPMFRGGFLWTGLATLAVIAAVTHGQSLVTRPLNTAVLSWIGTRSYGLYLYHWPIYQIIRKEAGISLSLAQFVIALVFTGAIAEASYRYLEMPIRKRTFHFPEMRTARPQLLAGLAVVGLLSGYAGISLATADVRCTSKIECDSEAASTSSSTPTSETTPGVDSTTTTAVDPSSTTSVVDPSVTSTTAVATTTTIGKPAIDVLALGESVMQGAQFAMRDQGFVVDARQNIQGFEMLAVVQQYMASNTITGAVVIQTGTNGDVTAEEYDQMMTAMAAVPTVIVLTVKAPKSWTEPNNALIRALPDRFPNVQVVDWQTRAPEVEADLSESDGGIHLSKPPAVRFYTNLILEALGRPLIPETAPETTAAG